MPAAQPVHSRLTLPPRDDDSVTISVVEAHRLLGTLSLTKFKQMVRAGQVGGAAQFGARWLIHRAIYMRWIEAQFGGAPAPSVPESQIRQLAEAETRHRARTARTGA